MANYLGRNVNLALLMIIIGVVVALVGTTVYFQRGLQNRTQEYTTTSTSLSSCQSALANYVEYTKKAQENATRVVDDLGKYNVLYEQKQAELKDAQTQLADTQKTLQFEKLQKEKFQQFYESERRTTAQLNYTVAVQQSDINTLKNRLSSCQDDLDTCEAGG